MILGIAGFSPAFSLITRQRTINSSGNIALSIHPVSYRSEIRAVLVHSASITGSVNWTLIAQTIKNAGADIMIVSAGELTYTRFPSAFASSNSGRDHVGEALAACKTYGLKLYVKFNILSAPPSSEYMVSVWNEDTGSLEQDGWVCPTKQASRTILRNIAEEIVTRYPDMDGFQFDYIRYELREECYCDDCKLKFIADNPECADVNWPIDVVIANGTAGRYFDKFMLWRPTSVNELVRDIRSWMLAINPKLEFSAAVFTYAYGTPAYPGYQRYWLGQDAAYWISQGWLDWVAPMVYTTDMNRFPEYIKGWFTFSLGGTEGIIPVCYYFANDYPTTRTTTEFKYIIDTARTLGSDGWNIWRYGGPGDGRTTSPDIRDYLSIIDLPSVFSIFTISYSFSGNDTIISWLTDKPSMSQVEYSTSPLFNATFKFDTRTISWTNERHYYWEIIHQPGSIVADATNVTSHNLTLSGLQPKTTYYFRVQSQDQFGIATSKVLTFTTP
jgi:hypothetical protein